MGRGLIFRLSGFGRRSGKRFALAHWPEIPEAIRRAILALLETVPNYALAPGSGDEAVVCAGRVRVPVVSHDLSGGVDPASKGERIGHRLVGRVDVEDILDVIFRDFCIGK